jgi:hypothetical protein
MNTYVQIYDMIEQSTEEFRVMLYVINMIELK